MRPKRIVINRNKCTGCRLCETRCTLHHYAEVNPLRSKIRIKKDDSVGLDIPMVCRQCKKPACLLACPNKAITQNKETGVIFVDIEKCKGTGACLNACPYGVVGIDPITRHALICDLCNGNPECIKWCFTRAIVFEENLLDRGTGEDRTITGI